MTIATPLALRTVPADKLAANLMRVATEDRYDRHREYAGGDIPFALWLALVDRRVMLRVGVGIFDLADAPLADYFEDGISPREAAGLVIEADDTFGAFALEHGVF